MVAIYLSDFPVSFTVPCGHKAFALRSRLKEHFLNDQSQGFDFEGQAIQNPKRTKYRLGYYCKKDDILRQLIEQTFLPSIEAASALFTDAFKLKQNDETFSIFKYVRFRLVADRKGYFLAPHHDSSDTLLAMLLPIYTDQKPTTGFRMISTFDLSLDTSMDMVLDFIGKKFQCDDIKRLDDQFAGNLTLLLGYSPLRSILFRVIKGARRLQIMAYRCSDLLLAPDELLALPNVSNKYFRSNLIEVPLAASAHGVTPTATDRVSLLGDVLMAKVRKGQKIASFYDNEWELILPISREMMV
jgi:hypothetical protein